MTSFINPFEKPASLSWTSREVVKEVNDAPHVFVVVEITGRRFPHRALDLAGRIGDIHSVFSTLSEDGTVARLYFPTDVPSRGTLEIGYGSELTESLGTLESAEVDRLDRKRLPDNFVDYTTKYCK